MATFPASGPAGRLFGGRGRPGLTPQQAEALLALLPRQRRRTLARVAWRTARRTARTTATLSRKGHARRRGLAPLYWAAVAELAAAVCHYSGTPAQAATAAGVSITGGAGALAWRGRRRGWTGGHWRPGGWRYHLTTAGAAAAFLEAGALAGPGAPMPGIAAVGALAAGVPWWWHHRIRPAVEVVEDPRVTIWRERVAGAGVLKAELFGLRQVPAGWRATIELAAGVDPDSVTAAVRRIAGAYGLPRHLVAVEPGAGEHLAELLVMAAGDPLSQLHPVTGLTLTDGWVTVGVYADGTPARWQLWAPGGGFGSGVCHGLICGTTGSGKSGILDTLCVELHGCDRAVLWLGDGQDGASSPDWAGHLGAGERVGGADWYAPGVAEVRRMLRAAERIMTGRNRRQGRASWTDAKGRPRRGRRACVPIADLPGLYVIIDEAPDVLADAECARIIGRIGKQGRKVAVGVILVTQVPSLEELGGKGVALRSMLASTNVAVLRVSDAYSAGMGAPMGLPGNPTKLRRVPGLGYLAAAAGRALTMRGRFVEDPYDWALLPAAGVLDAASAADAGEPYATRTARLAAWADGEDLADTRAEAEPAADGPTGTGDGSAPDRVLDVLAAAPGQVLRTGVIAARADLPLPVTSQALRRLADRGQVAKIGHGEWTAEPAEAA